MTEGNIWKQILFFSIPLILGNLLQQLYNTADSIIVGNFVGSEALAAVGSSGSLINLLISFCMGASAGAGVVIAQYYGANDKKRVQDAVHTTLAIAVVTGAILSIVGIVASPLLLQWMGTPKEVMPNSVLYLRIFFGGLVFNVIYNMAAGILNAVGNSKRSLIYLAIASVSNIVLDLVFVMGLHMGVAGVAIATDISQVLSSIFILRFLTRVDEPYRAELKKIRWDVPMANRIIKIGLPTGIQNMVISFSNVLIQSSVNGFGAKAMAGFAAYIKVDGFNILPVMSFSMAATTFTGQNIGAGKIDRVKNEKSLELPAMPQGAQLTIVVEGMGRINFGRAIKDYKGIIGNVTLTTQKEDCELALTPTRWNNSSIADDYQTAVNALAMPTNKMRGLQTKGGYYRGYFNLKKVGDTFINMEAFGKGQVYVNGHALGRFWQIGPQQTLYLPGCWLKKGKNEVIVLDVVGPKGEAGKPGSTVAPTAFCQDHPELDKLNLEKSNKHNEPGHRMDLNSETPVLKGEFKAGNGWQTIKLDKPVTGRYFAIQAESSQSGDSQIAIAEVYLQDAQGNRIDRNNWVAFYADSEKGRSEERRVGKECRSRWSPYH